MGAHDREAKVLRPTVPMKVPGARAGGPAEQELTVVDGRQRVTPKLPLPSPKAKPPEEPKPLAQPPVPSATTPPPLPPRRQSARADDCATQAIRGPAASRKAPDAAASSAKSKSKSKSKPKSKPKSPGKSQRMPKPFVGAAEVDERLALFVCAARRDHAVSLLEGLAEGPRRRATAHLERLLKAPSAERQGQLARAFGMRADAAGPLREIWSLAGPALRAEIFALLPPWLRSAFPDYTPPAAPTEGAGPEVTVEPAPPGLGAFAERLVREATR